MTVTCSFSLLLRLLVWLSVTALIAGVLLAGGSATTSEDKSPSVVRTRGEEVR
ncbi:hypothetical protein [Amycolatopsis minnesotensis]|uniref:Uncharacterized protein n=1 Tax=Amycolatopsis minnesotensis TaxID=337894 RepID=A0ABP5E4E0_9PSEU